MVQGAEAGGLRSSHDSRAAETQLIGLVCPLPQVADAVRMPVMATGVITERRGVAAALIHLLSA